MTSTDSAPERTECEMFFRLRRTELAIMGVLWDAGRGCTIPQIFEQLHSRAICSRNTVTITVAKLVRWNVLERHQSPRGTVYVPTVDREAVAAACVQEIISGIVGGNLGDGVLAVLKHLPVSAADLRAIRRCS